MVLVGNKTDLEDKYVLILNFNINLYRREVSFEEGLELANKNKMLFFETSAKMGYNIEEVFTASAKEISKRIDSGYYDLSSDTCGIKQGMATAKGNSNSNVKLDAKSKVEKKKGCC